jgi:hypothetical protein
MVTLKRGRAWPHTLNANLFIAGAFNLRASQFDLLEVLKKVVVIIFLRLWTVLG